jgi:creatine kinase/arginine kinase
MTPKPPMEAAPKEQAHPHAEEKKKEVAEDHKKEEPTNTVEKKAEESKDAVEKAPKEKVEVGSHLKSAEELKGWPKFPQGTKSLLSKFLTQEVWKKLKNTLDKYNFTFKQAIFSGCKNTDSGIGVYAGSHDSYTVFADLFDRIIETYHGHKKDAKHVSDMDFTKLHAPPFGEAEAKLIKSTRIRVGRNLADYPLGPGLT